MVIKGKNRRAKNNPAIAEAIEYAKNNPQIHLTDIAKKYNLVYASFYLHYKKKIGAEYRHKKKTALGRKRQYNSQKLSEAIQKAINKEGKIKDIADLYNIKYSTLKTYVSLYKSEQANKNIYTLNKINKLQEEKKEKEEEKEKLHITLTPRKIIGNEGEDLVAIDVYDQEKDLDFAFYFIKTNGQNLLCLNFISFVLGSKDNVQKKCYNEMGQRFSRKHKVWEKISLMDLSKERISDEERYFLLDSFFPIQMVLEAMRNIKISESTYEDLLWLYKLVKENKPLFEKV